MWFSNIVYVWFSVPKYSHAMHDLVQRLLYTICVYSVYETGNPDELFRSALMSLNQVMSATAAGGDENSCWPVG